MLWTIFVILLVLWLLGMVTSYTMGGFIHILLVIAIVVVLVRLIQGRKVIGWNDYLLVSKRQIKSNIQLKTLVISFKEFRNTPD